MDSGISRITQLGFEIKATFSTLICSNIFLTFLLLIYDLANFNFIPVNKLQKIMFHNQEFLKDDPDDDSDDYYPINMFFHQMGYQSKNFIINTGLLFFIGLLYKFKNLQAENQKNRIGSLYETLNLKSRWTMIWLTQPKDQILDGFQLVQLLSIQLPIL
ncbi:UNKNOWN [Stylonychia lemnae]|uniref:Transmembrane protein n=1 Tax=Stylonychia lemnae TaxID=5949 RepID=A0A078AYB8_STYLE|nr:UNKNOWN [Stylonychia lemnae]|eukprot:CDW87395.1 UNKNOWN [Stylonychia lemnae]